MHSHDKHLQREEDATLAFTKANTYWRRNGINDALIGKLPRNDAMHKRTGNIAKFGWRQLDP